MINFNKASDGLRCLKGKILFLLAMLATNFSLFAADQSTAPASAVFPLRLDAVQAEGGTLIQVDDGKPARLFSAAAAMGERIIWKMNHPLPPGCWRVDMEFYRPLKTACSPEQVFLIEGDGGLALGEVNLYYLGLAEGHFRQSIYMDSNQPVSALALQKSGQRNLDTASVISMTVSAANLGSVRGEPVMYHLAVNRAQVELPLEAARGVYVIKQAHPIALRWNLQDGRSFETPALEEIRVFLDQPAKMTASGGPPLTDFKATCYTEGFCAPFIVDGDPPLMLTSSLEKIEAHTLTLKGYRGDGLPKIDLLPEGKKLAVVTSWDDGKWADLSVAKLLKKYGVKGTFYMNRNSEMIGHLQELEALGMEIGSHSWSHPFLFNSTPERCFNETAQMRRFLEKELGHPIISFAYPFAYIPAYDADGDYLLRAVKNAGYWSGRSTANGDNWINAIPNALAMKPNFHFKAGPSRIKAKMEELQKTPGAILYFWGHSYESTGEATKTLEDDLALVANRGDTWYPTLGELMVWKFSRESLRIDSGKMSAAGKTFTLELPWLHAYLRQVPLSLELPDGVTDVLWDGQSIKTENGRVQLKW